MKNYIIILLCSIAGTLSCLGDTDYIGNPQNDADIKIDSVSVWFHQSHINIDPRFHNNGDQLDSIFKKVVSDSINTASRTVKVIKVIGAASPEGSVKFNRYLSEKRAEAIFKEFRDRGLLPDSAVSYTFLGRDWNGLHKMVEGDCNVPYRDEVLSLLDNVASTEHPLQKLKSIRGGVPYTYMYNQLFPELRTSKLVVEYSDVIKPITVEIPEETLQEEVHVTEIISTLEEVPVPDSYKPCRPFYMDVKTNLVSDLLLIPHICAEFYVGKGWSVNADWMYGWWDKDSRHYYWRAYGGTVGVRRWLGSKAKEKPLTGHHLGLFAGAVTYDFENGGKGYMGGLPHGTLWDRCNFVGGLEYGYSLPIARRLNIDFSLGIGVLTGKYYEYVPKNGIYIWQSTHKMRYFGPVKAEVSLVWLIGCDNYNRKKGGEK